MVYNVNIRYILLKINIQFFLTMLRDFMLLKQIVSHKVFMLQIIDLYLFNLYFKCT